MEKYCYFNGKIMPLKKAKINLYDLGILRGYGVFDVMRSIGGGMLHCHDHWKRLRNSAGELGLKIPVSEKEFENIVKNLVRKNGYRESVVRTVLTGGISPDAFSIGEETFYILIEKFIPLPKNIYQEGAKLITLEYERHHPHAKITNYVMAIKNLKKKKREGALEMLFIKNGKVLEASTSNFFIIKNKKIITPKDGILHGITKKLVIQLARKNKFKVEEREVREDEIYSADEAFISASNKDIVPVVIIGNKIIGTKKPGPITKHLMELFSDYLKNY